MLRCDHLVLELQHRPEADLEALKAVTSDITLGIGVIDVKVNPIETPDDVAASIEKSGENIGRWTHWLGAPGLRFLDAPTLCSRSKDRGTCTRQR